MNLLRQLLSEDDSEDQQVELNSKERIWFKFETPSGFFYSPFIRSKNVARCYNSPQEMIANLKQSDDYDIKTDNIALVYEKNTPSSEPEILPNGIYFHEYASSGLPERLSPMNLRNDNYVTIMNSLESLDGSIEDFVNNKELYTDTKTLYKLGILVFGPPGTGKTCYMREFIRKKQDAITIFMEGVPTRKFLQKIEEATKNRLKILVFEEAVSLMEDSDDIRNMLDFLDGSKSISNAIYFLSTNYPESIPENVVRNGRIDLFVRVDFPSEEARKKLVNLYLKRDPTADELKLTENMPIVDIRELCFHHKKTSKTFQECVKLIEEKNKMLKKHFGKSKEIRLT